MYSKTTFFAIVIVIAVAAVFCSNVTAEVIPQGVIHQTGRSNRFLFDFLLNSHPICKGCPPHYCDADPGLIIGYCCGCRRALDILPIHCPPTLFCPASLSAVCHDYEYMLHCCC